MRNRRNVVLALILIFAVAAVVGVIGLYNIERYQGEQTKEADAYLLDFTSMNQVNSHTMHLLPGEELAVNIHIKKGRVDVKIMMDEEIIYRGDHVDRGTFSLPINQEADYTITVHGYHAVGSTYFQLK